jgi:hypothetical protein
VMFSQQKAPMMVISMSSTLECQSRISTDLSLLQWLRCQIQKK